MSTYKGLLPITPEHNVDAFRCGQPTLDDWLVRYALMNQRAGMTTTFVVTDGVAPDVVGLY